MIADLLEQSDIFGGLGEEDRSALAEQFERMSLDAGEVLVSEGEQPLALYLLASGTVEVEREDKAIFGRLGPGESFGLVALITDTPYAATVKVLTPLSAYRLSKESIAAAVMARPEIVVGLETLMVRGRSILERELASHEETPLENQEMFSRFRQFLRRLKS